MYLLAMLQTASHIDSFIRERLSEPEWKHLSKQHERCISEQIDDYLEKRERHHKDPVMDFLFEYYAFRPSRLKSWSPGFGVLLEGSGFSDPELRELAVSGEGAFLDPALFPFNRKSSVQWTLGVLENSAGKNPFFGCFGMHEWAMVYKTGEIRHARIPLRMSKRDVDKFVESRPLVCTHFDAFRFFTDKARPMNKHKLNRNEFSGMEQPGCIHTNMDLYKWAFKMYPWISSETIRKAFELAVEARFIDMRASPYDLRTRGLEPIKIETGEGRLEYLKKQKEIFEKAKPVRKELISEYRYLVEFFNC